MPPINVYVLHPSSRHCEEIAEAFRQYSEELNLAELTDLRGAVERLAEVNPNVVVAGVDTVNDPILKVIESISRRIEGLGIVVVSKNPSQELLLECMRAGSDEFLEFPIDIAELSKALKRLFLKMGLIAEEEGKVIGVYSANGGCGTTTTACNLGANIAREMSDDGRCCILDMNLQFGSVALFMDIREFSFTLADAVRSKDRLDAGLMESYMSKHSSGAAVLPAPVNMAPSEEVEPEAVGTIIQQCKKLYKFIILDIPTVLDEHTIACLDSSNEIFLICDMMVPSVRNTIRAMDLFEQLEYKKDKFRLIVNRYYESEQISLREISRHIRLPIYWLIPYDARTVESAVNSGQVVDEVDASSEVAHSFIALAQHCLGLQPQTTKKRFSLFGGRR